MTRPLKILIIIIAILILAGFGWLAFRRQGIFRTGNQGTAQSLKVEYLTEAEKSQLNFDPNLQVQVLSRGQGVYKIIKSDSDVVTSLDQVQAQRPSRADNK